jgi:hypothetical protein
LYPGMVVSGHGCIRAWLYPGMVGIRAWPHLGIMPLVWYRLLD